MIRHCFICGEQIDKCMGYIVAGDMLLAMDGQIDFGCVRERCAICVERHDLANTLMEIDSVQR